MDNKIDLDAIIKEIPGLDLWANNKQLRTQQRLAMIEAIHQALILASEKANLVGNSKYNDIPVFTDNVDMLGADYSEYNYTVNKQSILDVDQLIV